MKQNTLLWDREAYTPRRGAYPHYYELIMEAVRSNPCISLPLEILKQVDCLEIIVILSQFQPYTSNVFNCLNSM